MKTLSLIVAVLLLILLWVACGARWKHKNKKDDKEGYFNEDAKTFWRDYYYSNAAKPGHLYGGMWPDGMYSRMYYWYPGFETSGWSTEARPGTEETQWPRSRWERNDGSYYYINNKAV